MNKEYPKRKSIRLKEYDYSKEGYYYITVCTKNKELYFKTCEIKDIVHNCWIKIPDYFKNVGIDEFVIMPNHLHGLLIIDKKLCQINELNKNIDMKHKPTIGEIIRYFKARTTHIMRKNNSSEFSWQRNYYEHIIRNEKELNRMRKYIIDNPLKWELDKYNPKRLQHV